MTTSLTALKFVSSKRPTQIPSVQLRRNKLVNKLHEQKGITVTHDEMEGAGHFFEDPYMDPMIDTVRTYVRRRLTENTR